MAGNPLFIHSNDQSVYGTLYSSLSPQNTHNNYVLCIILAVFIKHRHAATDPAQKEGGKQENMFKELVRYKTILLLL